jgi:hypothetical protein
MNMAFSRGFEFDDAAITLATRPSPSKVRLETLTAVGPRSRQI